MTSSTVAFRAQRVVLQFPEEGTTTVSGVLSYRSDLGRLSRLLATGRPPANSRWSGSLTGVVEASHDSGVTELRWTSDAKDVVYAEVPTARAGAAAIPVSQPAQWREVWREPLVKLAGHKLYDHRRDRLSVTDFSADAATTHVVLKGTIDRCTDRCVADLSVAMDYDLADLTAKLRPVFGPHVQLAGREKGRLTITGPLRQPAPAGSAESPEKQAPAAMTVALTSATRRSAVERGLVPPQLMAAGDFAWQSANIHGLLVGQGNLQAALAEGVLHFTPLQLPVSEGRFQARPRIDLRADPATLHIDKGPLVENVRISPEMCQTWLKYVAPLLADATRAEGRFSVTLDRAEVPLTETAASDILGQLTIHTAKVGPGPLAQEFITLAEQIKSLIDGRPGGGGSRQASTWLVIPEQEVRFDVTDGRVQHQGLTVTVGDVVIRTNGSVGFDETLSLTAEVPVRDEWVAGKQYLKALKGTVLRVPVGGTLSQPRVDARHLQKLTRGAVRDAAGRLIEEELNRGLERLFGPSR
jgi:hypothetical protein